mgnify:CR=1 FL=1
MLCHDLFHTMLRRTICCCVLLRHTDTLLCPINSLMQYNHGADNVGIDGAARYTSTSYPIANSLDDLMKVRYRFKCESLSDLLNSFSKIVKYSRPLTHYPGDLFPGRPSSTAWWCVDCSHWTWENIFPQLTTQQWESLPYNLLSQRDASKVGLSTRFELESCHSIHDESLSHTRLPLFDWIAPQLVAAQKTFDMRYRWCLLRSVGQPPLPPI